MSITRKTLETNQASPPATLAADAVTAEVGDVGGELGVGGGVAGRVIVAETGALDEMPTELVTVPVMPVVARVAVPTGLPSTK